MVNEMSPGPSLPAGGPLRSFAAAPKAVLVRVRKRGAWGRRRGGQLRSARFLLAPASHRCAIRAFTEARRAFTALATPPSSRAVVRPDRCSRAARRSGGLLKKRADGAGKADEGVVGGVNKKLAERSRPPPRRLCLNSPETQRRTADVPRDRTGPEGDGKELGFSSARRPTSASSDSRQERPLRAGAQPALLPASVLGVSGRSARAIGFIAGVG